MDMLSEDTSVPLNASQASLHANGNLSWWEPCVASGGALSSGASKDIYRDLAIASLAIAKRFSNGATMWSFAPHMAAHALHIAVEFVHPVIVGKKALPALALLSDDPIAELRHSSKAGDLFVGVGPGDDVLLIEAMKRARVYGLTSIWISSGPRPAIGSANHVIALDNDPQLSAYLGYYVMLYHLLWECTHVCYEHPGLLKAKGETCSGPTCMTCSDEAEVMEIERSLDSLRAVARGPAGVSTIDVSLIDKVAIGDLVLVQGTSAINHVGSSW